MSLYTEMREPPLNRRGHCMDGMEQHFTEGAVMIAFAMYLFDQGAREVELHPDGEHGKRYDLKECLKSNGFNHVSGLGKTSYGGIYHRDDKIITVTCKP